MKKIMLFVTEWCPHCKNARRFISELLIERPDFAEITLRIIDEEREKALAESHDYYYVPTFYVDDVKVHEGAVNKDAVRCVFEKALEI